MFFVNLLSFNNDVLLTQGHRKTLKILLSNIISKIIDIFKNDCKIKNNINFYYFLPQHINLSLMLQSFVESIVLNC